LNLLMGCCGTNTESEGIYQIIKNLHATIDIHVAPLSCGLIQILVNCKVMHPDVQIISLLQTTMLKNNF
jgi:hypothetical protein